METFENSGNLQHDELFKRTLDQNFGDFVGWKTIAAPVYEMAIGTGTPVAGTVGTGALEAMNFDAGDSMHGSFLVPQDILAGTPGIPFVNFTTDGVDTDLVKFQLTYAIIKNHSTDVIAADTIITAEMAPLATAWTVYQKDFSANIVLAEPMSLVIFEIERVAPSGGTNADEIFPLQVGIAYQSDRGITDNRVQPFLS